MLPSSLPLGSRRVCASRLGRFTSCEGALMEEEEEETTWRSGRVFFFSSSLIGTLDVDKPGRMGGIFPTSREVGVTCFVGCVTQST